MGIFGYFINIIRKHPDILKINPISDKIHHFYLDSNSIIYDIVNNIDTSLEYENLNSFIIQSVKEKIEDYITRINPIKSISICFDGIPPFSKIEQQRLRRFKSIITDNILGNKEKIFDTIHLTSGTEFMTTLSETLKLYFMNKYSNLYFSGSDEVGEGEHKIFNIIRENNHFQDTHVVYGLDSDLIMIALSNLYKFPNFLLYRETPWSCANSIYFLDLNLLAKIICKNMGNDDSINYNILQDYVLLCMLIGNDFLPSIPALNVRSNRIEDILSCYRSNIYPDKITVGTLINWKKLSILISELSKREEEFLIIEYNKKKQKKIYKKTREEKLEILPSISTTIEDLINPTQQGWNDRYYYYLFNTTHKQEITNICKNYIGGMEWTLKYYMDGAYDWRWKYNYCSAPLLSDISKTLSTLNVDFFTEKKFNPVSTETQLIYCIPFIKFKLIGDIHQRKHHEFIKEYGELFYDYDNVKLYWEFKKYFYECHILLPEINIDEMDNFLNNL